MAREIDLIGYSKGVDDFISNGMSMQRTIPYSGDDTRVHHEQKLLPGLSVGGGDVAAYDGPFAISYNASTAIATVLGGYIIAGTTTFFSAYGQVALGSDGFFGNYVYIDITSSGTSLSSSLAATYDWNIARRQTDSTYRVCLGHVTNGGKVTQYQHGDIYVTGRLV